MKFILLALLFPLLTFARPATNPKSRLSYDVSASQSSQNGRSYQEINLGLNWFLSEWMIFRNSAFQRQSQDQDTVYGLDSSLRFQHSLQNEENTLGLKVFGGPGLRVASEKSNAYFGEAGVGIRLGGIQLTAGIKSLQYVDTRLDSNGNKLPNTENQIFIGLAGSGSL